MSEEEKTWALRYKFKVEEGPFTEEEAGRDGFQGAGAVHVMVVGALVDSIQEALSGALAAREAAEKSDPDKPH